MTPPDPTPPTPRRNCLRPLALLIVLAALTGAAGAAWVWGLFTGSLPLLAGTFTVDGLTASVRIERDERGIPTLKADNRGDLAFATGFVHGQDRFFQMDLLRRHPAGELAELVGAAAVAEDSKMRRHRFRHRAGLALKRATSSERELLTAYAAGVEAGRRSLRQKPWEYLLLRAEPRPWSPEDSLLVGFAMYHMLQSSNVPHERTQGVVEDVLPPALARFLSPAGSPWDAPLLGDALPSAAIPDADAIDLRKDPRHWTPPGPPPVAPLSVTPGSNNWAVAGTHTVHGGAIVACDMHLGLMVPSIWYRAAFVTQAGRVVGATLPGTPAMVVGSNGRIAWGFTNVEGDTSDLVILRIDPNNPNRYRTPDGWKTLERHEETIRVNAGTDVTITVEETIWGPVIGRDHQRRPLALRWLAHDPEAVNLDLIRMEQVGTVEEALDLAAECGTPAQNFVVADRKGHIGWTILGRLPRRVGFDGRIPSTWDDGARKWNGFLPAESRPRLIDPPNGRVWTANNRTIGEPYLSRVGIGTYDHGARAKQIRDGLLALPKARESDMLAIQLDDRAVFLERWQKLMLDVLDSEPTDERRAAVRREVLYWGGRASPDSVGFRLVRQFRDEVKQAILLSLTAPCQRADPGFSVRRLDPNVDESVWLLVTKKPAHLLPPDHASWDALLQSRVENVIRSVGARPTFEERLRAFTWAARNRPQVRHPLSGGLGSLGQWLDVDMARLPLPGDTHAMPRVQGPSDGASQRMAVSPGREEEGYFHMPAGQSSHPHSPHFRDGHEDWAKGRASPFLPGPAVHVLELHPER